MATTAWGNAEVIEEVSIRQTAEHDGEEKHFTTLVQLLHADEGERLVRFAYSTGGAVRRGPVTLRASDLEHLRKALRKAPGLRAVLSRAGVTL